MQKLKKYSPSEIARQYAGGKSAREIASQFDLSLNLIYRYLRKNSIARRTNREQNLVRFQRKTPSFKIKKTWTVQEQKLFVAGVMLYWGEGSQWAGERIVDFANSNPAMIKVFIHFLREICGVEEKRLRCYLYCYSTQSVDDLIEFWSSLTVIPKVQFTKPYVRHDFNPDKIGKMPHGLIHIRYGDKKLLTLFREWIKNTSENLINGQVAERQMHQTVRQSSSPSQGGLKNKVNSGKP